MPSLSSLAAYGLPSIKLSQCLQKPMKSGSKTLADPFCVLHE